jgi:hypothetical protein
MYKFILFCLLAITASANAQYQPHAIWSREGAGDSSLYGSSILALGDQNNDGFNDWAVFAQGNANDTWHGAQPGYIDFFHGGNPPSSEPYMVRTLDTTNEESLWNAYSVGDLNGDHYIDWIVVAQLNDGSFNNVWKLYFGGPGSHETPDLVLTSGWFSAYFGIGDFNGDHFDDLYLWDNWNERVAVYYGGNPMDTIPDWQRADDLIPKAGDLNGDGVADLLCISNLTHGTNIFFGSAYPDTIPAIFWPNFGCGVIRDINRDSFDDLCFGGRGFGALSWGGPAMDTIEDTRLNFPCDDSGPDWIVSAGDFNHDGFNDVVMAREWCDNSYWGTLTVHLGGWWMNPQPAFVIEGWTDPFNLIHFKTAMNLGDINGDHIDDLAIGANGGIEQAAWRGKVVILGGDDSLRADADDPFILHPSSFRLSAYPNPFNPATTISFTLAKTGSVDLKVYDVTGRKTGGLLSAPTGVVAAGEHSMVFDGSDLPSGIYFVRMEAGGISQTKKIVLLK